MARGNKKSRRKKGRGVVIPKKSNAYIQKRDARVDAFRTAEKDTAIQYLTDTLMLTLNDSEVMGKDVFGKARLAKVIGAWGQKWDLFHGAFEVNEEQSYYQAKLDEALRKIMDDDLVVFKDRYPWLKDAD